jgi:hypothetical protein
MNNFLKPLETIHRTFDEAEIDHALIGGLALEYLGLHRTTVGIDLLVDGEMGHKAIEALQELGFELHSESGEAMQFTGEVDVHILLANRTPTRMMLKNAHPIKDLGIKCVGPEDIIGLKIEAYMNNPSREAQDKADIAALMQKYPSMDWDRVEGYADLFDQWPAMEKLKKEHDL